MENAIQKPQARRKARPTDFFACMGKERTCTRPALPNEVLCASCAAELNGRPVQIEKPFRILIRAHFSPISKYGQTIVNILGEENGVRVVRRTKERQLALDEHRKLLSGGIRVFGERDLRPLVTVEDAVEEMKSSGYGLHDIHILDMDEILKGTDREEERGGRIIVFNYEWRPESIVMMPEYGHEILTRPFVGCRVLVNLRDPVTGVTVHCVELTSLQFKQEPRIRLKFANSCWWYGDVTDYSREADLGESDRDLLLREIN